MIDKTILHYNISKKLGEGGMGEVYLSDDTKLNRQVAIKFLPSKIIANETDKARFLQEAQAAAAINHPNVCVIHDIIEHDAQQFIVMEYVEGQTLSEKISSGPIPLEQALEYAIQIGNALQAAHDKGIVHRDIKSDNIMISKTDQIKVMDFGLAKLKGSVKLTKSSSTVGTLAYSAPEQIEGKETDNRSDIFSFGVVLYEMLAGQRPYQGDYESALMYSILNEAPEPIDGIASGLNDIIKTTLSKNPDERYQNIEELISNLKVIRSESDPSQKISRDRTASKVKGLNKHIKFIVYPVIVVVVLFAGYLINRTLISKEIEPVPIMVTSFKNQTGDSAYDVLQNVIPNLLITDLEQSKYFHVNTWERLRDLLIQSGQKDREFIDVDLGIQLAKMDNIPAIVTGSIAKIGDMFSIDIKVLDTGTKEILKSANSVGKGENSILEHQVDELVEQIATAIDLPDKEFAKTTKPVLDVTTTSLEAYKYYLVGKENYDAWYLDEAKENFAKAIRLDSTFAMAHLFLARSYWKTQHIKESIVQLEMAEKYRYKVTGKEQILIDYYYTAWKGVDASKRINVLKKATLLYPKEKQIFMILGDYHLNRAADTSITYYKRVLDLDPTEKTALNGLGYAYLNKKDYPKALEYLQRYADLVPNEANPYDSMGEVYLRMKDHTKSIEMYEKSLKIKPDFTGSHLGIVTNYIKMREYRQARNHLNQWSEIASSDPEQETIHHLLATTYIVEGDLENTLKELEKRGELAEQSSDTLLFVDNQFIIAEILFENDKIKKAEEIVAAGKKVIESEALSESIKNTLWEKYFFTSTRLALIKGNMDQAKKYADMYKNHLEKVEDPGYLQWYFTLSGLIAYAEGNYEKAIADLLQSDLNDPFNSYHLALAYINNGDKKNAIDNLENAVNYSLDVSLVYEEARVRAEKQLALLKADE